MTGIASAIANRNSQHCWIPIIGDSVTLGQGATAIGSRWASVASATLRSKYPTSANGSGGGVGYLNMTNTSPALTYTWPVTLTGTPGWTDTPLGAVRQGWSMSGAGSWSWATPAGTTSVRIMYYATGNGSQITVTGGSGGPVTITDSVAGADGALSVSIPVAGAQTLSIAYTSGPSLFISGAIHYAGDENNGITIHACGHYGWSAASWPGAQGFSGFPFDPSIAALCSASALGIFLGINDCQAVNAATFQANMITLITELQGFSPLGSVPLIIIIPYQPNVSIFGGGSWNSYVTALYNVAGMYSGTTVVDLNANMPSVATGGSLYVDTVHPSNSGHALLASIFAAAMPAPPSGGLLMAGATGMGLLCRSPSRAPASPRAA